MSVEDDPKSSAQLETMGFTSFGQQHKRPKHHHNKGPVGATPDTTKLPGKPAQLIQSQSEMSSIGGNYGVGSLAQYRQGQNQEVPEGGRLSSQHLTGGEYGDAYYSKSFVENPWEKLERIMGIFVEAKESVKRS